MRPDDYRELRQLVRVDARMRIRHRSACEGKHRFESYNEAKRTLSWNLRKKAKPYHCVECNGFHIGNIVNNRRKRVAIARFA